MEEKKRRKRRIIAVLLAGIVLFPVGEVQAGTQEKDMEALPHLVQTVTDREVCESRAVLGLSRTELAEQEEPEQTLERVRGSIVRLDMNRAYGSGMIWKFEKGAVIIATNAHVLDFWEDHTGVVCFLQGFTKEAEQIGCSEKYDTGFLQIPMESFSNAELAALVQVNPGEEGTFSLKPGQEVIYVGAAKEAGELMCCRGTLEDLALYIPDFSMEMLYGRGSAKKGMSGGGMFDLQGRCVGMLTGGTDQGETASIPAQKIAEAYAEISKHSANDSTDAIADERECKIGNS